LGEKRRRFIQLHFQKKVTCILPPQTIIATRESSRARICTGKTALSGQFSTSRLDNFQQKDRTDGENLPDERGRYDFFLGKNVNWRENTSGRTSRANEVTSKKRRETRQAAWSPAFPPSFCRITVPYTALVSSVHSSLREKRSFWQSISFSTGTRKIDPPMGISRLS